MRTYQLLWGGLLTGLTASAVAAMVRASEPSQVLALVVALGSLGVVLGMAWGTELPVPRHPVLAGGAVAAVASLALPGLVVLTGWWAGPLCVLLTVSSPWVVGSPRIRRMVGAGRPGPTGDEAGARLRADWEASTRALATASCRDDRLLLAGLRERLLEEIEEHHGALPAYVWGPAQPRGAEPEGHERSGPGPRDLGP